MANKEEYLEYCLNTESDTVFKSKDFYFILGIDKEENKQSDKVEIIKKADEALKINSLVDQFDKFDMAESPDTLAFNDIRMLIDERLIQISGHLFKYDAEKDKNLLVAQNCFFCVDRMHGDSRHMYIFHVLDTTQAISYTRVEVKKEPALNYSFSEIEKMLFWVGQPQED